ncbi:MAG: DUF1501 domain-containing protein [Bacteroidota bacterium]
MMTNRRDFIKGSALATTSLFVPKFLRAFGGTSSSMPHKKLVVIQLSGGNDGLNTVIPYANDIYYRTRPGIGLQRQNLIAASDVAAFNENLYDFTSMFDKGEVSILNSVGYPNPNRSHFRSMDIWQTGSDSDQYLNTGWIGRILDHNFQNASNRNARAIEINETLNLAMKGDAIKGLAMQSTKALHRITKHPYLQALSHHEEHRQQQADYLYKTLSATTESAHYLFEKTKTYRSKVSYPNNILGKQLQQVASLINADAVTQIYYVSLSGFDTHAGQRWKQGRLLKQYSKAVSAFVNDLKMGNRFDDTMIMTFSEFGRRVKQNASGGTDHGAANNLFLIGGKLKKPGFYNAMPDLSDLDDGDIKYQIDFRQVYATLIEKWLGYESKAILSKGFSLLDLY